jgi:hypothetical protein
MLSAFLLLSCLIATAPAAELEASFDPVLPVDGTPVLKLTSPNFDCSMMVECQVGERTLSWEMPEVKATSTVRVELPRDPAILSAFCQASAYFANGHREGVDVPMSWRYQELDTEGDASQVSLDVTARVAVLPAPFPCVSATVQGLNGKGEPLFEDVVALRTRTERATVRWSSAGAAAASTMRFTLVGEQGETVTYDMKVVRR